MTRGESNLGRETARRCTRRRALQLGAAGLATTLSAHGAPIGAFAQDATPCPETTPEEAVAVAEAYFAAFNAGDADALDTLLSPDYRHQGALVNKQDREIHLQRLRTNHTAFPDG